MVPKRGLGHVVCGGAHCQHCVWWGGALLTSTRDVGGGNTSRTSSILPTHAQRKQSRRARRWGPPSPRLTGGIGAASAVLRALHRPVVVKRELSQKAKLSIYWSIYVPILTYGHELWLVTERTRLQIQAAEMGFLRRVSGLSLREVEKSAGRGSE